MFYVDSAGPYLQDNPLDSSISARTSHLRWPCDSDSTPCERGAHVYVRDQSRIAKLVTTPLYVQLFHVAPLTMESHPDLLETCMRLGGRRS